MEKLIVSMMRFSTALTLLGLEQLERAVTVDSGEDLSKTMEGFRATLDSLTDTVSRELNHKKQATLESVTNMSEEAVHRTMGGMSLDPREFLRNASDLMRKTSDSVVDLLGKGASIVEASLEEDKPAATEGSTKHKAKHRKKGPEGIHQARPTGSAA